MVIYKKYHVQNWKSEYLSMVLKISSLFAFRYMLERFNETEDGRRILLEKPRIDGATLESLADLPPDTLGGVYYAFMKK